MAHKYKFVFDAGVPEDVRKEFPEHVEAGPVTLSIVIGGFRLGPEYEVIPDTEDYILHVRKKGRKAA